MKICPFRLLRTVFFWFFPVLCSFGVVFLPLGVQESPEDYWSLLAQLKSGDTRIDCTRLRMLFAKLPGYNPYRDLLELRGKENATRKAYKAGNLQLANNQGIVITEYMVMWENLPTPMDLRGYLEFVQQDRLHPSAVPGYTPQETSDTELSGLPALHHDFLFTSNGQQLKGRVIFVILGKEAYSFLFYATTDDFPNLEGTFTQALASVPIQSVSEKSGPTGQPQLAKNLYQDPRGLFEMFLPDEATQKENLENGVVFKSPDSGEIYIMKFVSEKKAASTAQEIAQGKEFRAETSFNVDEKQAQVCIYTFIQNNENYTMLGTTYSGIPVLLIIVVPAGNYDKTRN